MEQLQTFEGCILCGNFIHGFGELSQALSMTVLTPPVELNGGSPVSAVAVSWRVLDLRKLSCHVFGVHHGPWALHPS